MSNGEVAARARLGYTVPHRGCRGPAIHAVTNVTVNMNRILIPTLALFCSFGCNLIPTLDDIILRPESGFEMTPIDLGFPFEEATIPVNESRSIVVWTIPAENAKALVLVIPGSDANKGRYVEVLPILTPNGYSTILMDYAGFGDSPGMSTLDSVLDDAGAAIAFAKTQHEHVFAFSASLGTPLLAHHAQDVDLAGCIFEGSLILLDEPELWLRRNGFAVVADPFGGIANFWTHPQIPPEYDILHTIRGVDEPKLFLHSIEDETTPYEGGVRVFEAASEPKMFYDMRGEHGKAIRIDFDAYAENLRTWLDATLADRLQAE